VRNLPWSLVPLRGFEDAGVWLPRCKPDSPGWTPEGIEPEQQPRELAGRGG